MQWGMIAAVGLCFAFGAYHLNMQGRLDAMAADHAAKIRELTDAYDAAIETERENVRKMQSDSVERLKQVADLERTADSLRMQLSERAARASATMPRDTDRSKSAVTISSQRLAAMENALRGAAELIRERDRCAIDYNTLMKQCKRGTYGDGNHSD